MHFLLHLNKFLYLDSTSQSIQHEKMQTMELNAVFYQYYLLVSNLGHLRVPGLLGEDLVTFAVLFEDCALPVTRHCSVGKPFRLDHLLRLFR